MDLYYTQDGGTKTAKKKWAIGRLGTELNIPYPTLLTLAL